MKKYLLFIVVTLFSSIGLIAQNQGGCRLIPLPQKIEEVNAVFKLTDKTSIICEPGLADQASYLQTALLRYTGISAVVGSNTDLESYSTTIILKLVPEKKNKEVKSEESYSIKMNAQETVIEASTAKGIFYGIVSLVQLARFSEKRENHLVEIDCLNILDEPLYAWRGLMLDESRHFFGKEKVKQLLDWMAMYKLNRFHWHLTDAPGWRIEIKEYPKLGYIGGIGNHTYPYTKAEFYTQEEVKEIIRYAKERNIEVIPEIDMPGHAAAANRAYPEFSGGGSERYPDFTFNPGKDTVYTFLTHVLKEIDALFPSQIIHLGGDEVHFGNENWKSDKSIQALMKRENITNLKDVENYFLKRMADSVIVMNNKIAAWDEVAESDLPTDKTIVFFWRHDKPSQLQKAVDKGFPVVLCPRIPLYFDFVQDASHKQGRTWSGDFSSIDKVYAFNHKSVPVSYPANANILGIQANIWTETIVTPQRLDFMLFPRIAALAEAGWTEDRNKNFDHFNKRLREHLKLYGEDNIYYYDPFSPQNTCEPVK